MKTRRKLLTGLGLALAAIFIFSCFAGLTACSEDEEYVPDTAGDLTYTTYYDGSGYAVSGIGEWTDPNLYIPSEHNGLPVVAISDFAFCDIIEERGYSFIETITIPDTVEHIGAYAFCGCDGVEVVTLGAGVKEVGYEAFYGLDSLKEVHISDLAAWCEIDWGYGSIFAYNPSADLYLKEGKNDEILYDAVIPNGVEKIGYSAFAYCTTIRSVTIPSSVTSIGNYAFYGCTSLEVIYIPEETTFMGSYVFSGCYDLIIFAGAESQPGGWSSTWNYEDCDVYWGRDGLPTENINFYFVVNNGKDNVTVSAPWLSITNLPDVTYNGYVLAGWYTSSTFESWSAISTPYYCESTDVVLYARWEEGHQSEGLKVYDGYVTGIGTCEDAEIYVTLPVEDSAFYGCGQLTAVHIEEGCTYLGDYSFAYCNSLTKIYYEAVNANTSSYYNYVFYRSGESGEDASVAVSIGANVETIPYYLFYYSNITSVTFAGNSRCEVIGNYAFRNCYSLESIDFPDSLKEIGYYAFQNCSALTSVTIPENVTYIGDYAFEYCYSLTEINYNATNANSDVSNLWPFEYAGSYGDKVTVTIGANVESIPEYLFYYSYITSVVFEEESICESIGQYAFYDCYCLTSVVIPASIESIGYYAFNYCDSLSTVYYEGTSTGWSNISINSGNSYLTNADRYYYSENDISLDGYWHYVNGVPTLW